MTDACVGLGANLGDSHETLQWATNALAALPATRLTGVSRIFRSAPVGPPGQDDYLNAAVRLETELGPELLLDQLQAIEQNAGRVRIQRWGPRTLDLDLLLFGDASHVTERLQVPHPRLVERNFVLLPLIDLLGEERILDDRSLAAWLDAAPANRIAATDLGLPAAAAVYA